MIDRELEAAFDDLFVGDNPPLSTDDAIARLPVSLRSHLDRDADARQALAELVWMSNTLRASPPRPSQGFADRITNAAFQTTSPPKSRDWRLATVGTIIVASLLFAVALSLWPKQPEGPGVAPGMAETKSAAEPPTLVLLDQFKKIVPKMPSETPLANVEVASLIGKADTGSLAQTFASPAESLSNVGKTLGKEVKPIGNSVRDAFAFLGEFPAREKRSL